MIGKAERLKGSFLRPRRWAAVLLLPVLVCVWVLSASRPGSRIEGCAQGCASAGPRREGPLRVMSLNVLHGFPRFEHLSERLERVAEEIRLQDADIVCLQEVPWTLRTGSAAEILARRTGLNHLYLRAAGNRWAILFEEGEAILSRYPLVDSGRVELEPQPAFFEHRVALRATAVTPWGPLHVFVTHLTDGDSKVNRLQVGSLETFVGASVDGPVIVAGDFNAREATPQIRMIGWTDTYRAVHPDDPGLTCCIDEMTGPPGEPLEERIDYIFFDAGGGAAQVVDSRIVLGEPWIIAGGWLWASDHLGLLTTIQME